jgi:cytochrome c2
MGALFVVAVLVGITWDYARTRTQVRAHAAAITGGDPSRGEALFIQYGCGSCHAVQNVRTATGAVGPPLDGIPARVILAGHLANNPANMEHWIRDPQQVSPGTAMPDLQVSKGDARDITAFLYTRH